MVFEKGRVFWDYDYKYHIVDVIKDGEEILIVYKYFGKYKQWWHYKVDNKWAIEMGFEYKNYSLNGKLKRGNK